jgi:hypothetical protein
VSAAAKLPLAWVSAAANRVIVGLHEVSKSRQVQRDQLCQAMAPGAVRGGHIQRSIQSQTSRCDFFNQRKSVAQNQIVIQEQRAESCLSAGDAPGERSLLRHSQQPIPADLSQVDMHRILNAFAVREVRLQPRLPRGLGRRCRMGHSC